MLRNVYQHVDVDASDVTRALALQLVLPRDGVVSGRTAAWLHGVWRPRPGTPVPLEYARPLDRSGSPFRAMRRRRLSLIPTLIDGVPELRDGTVGDVVEVHGVRVASVLRTCFELMRDRGLVEAVVVADAFAHEKALTLPWLDAYVELHKGWPWVKQARTVVQLASSQARSPGETRLRMIVVLGRLPEPLINVPVWAGRPSTLIGYPDLAIVGTPRVVCLEYDGAYHGDTEQHVLDNRRENRFVADAGLPLLRFGSSDVGRYYAHTLEQIVKASGWRRSDRLEHSDFRRPPPHLAW